MSTTDTEKHCRLCMMLMKGGTKASQQLFLKRVKELTPHDHQPFPWSVENFLLSKRKYIEGSKMASEHFKLLFPTNGQVDLTKWDLSLFCNVLTSYCDLKTLTRLDVLKLRSIRNKLCHANEQDINGDNYDEYSDAIKVCIERILDDDNEMKNEIGTLLNDIHVGPLSLADTVKQMRMFYKMESDIREKIENIKDVENRILRQVERYDEKFEELYRKLDQIKCNKLNLKHFAPLHEALGNFLMPEVEVVIFLTRMDANISKVIVQLLKKAVSEDDSQPTPNAGLFVKLWKAVYGIFTRFLERGWRIISARDKCVQLYIRCNTFTSLASLFREFASGSINIYLVDLRDALSKIEDREYGEVEAVIYKDEFWKVIDKAISSVEKILSEDKEISPAQMEIKQSGDDDITHFICMSIGARRETEEKGLAAREAESEPHIFSTLTETEIGSNVPHVSVQQSGTTKEDLTASTRLTATTAQRTERESGFSPNDLEVFQKPMCLISTEKKGALKLETKAAEQIAKIDWPIVVVSVVGLYRTGKSYLMNRLAESTKGFALGDTIESTTKGIWVWCKIHPEKSNTVLLLLDTEGLGDVEKEDPSHDNKIFTLATLLCNCLLYNMKGTFDQDAVSKLTFITEMAKNIRFRGESSDDNSSLSLILPDFLLCLRDFSLKFVRGGNEITEDEYLEHSLAIQKGQDDKLNKPRECIQKYFPVRKCFTFPVPGDYDVLDNLETLEFNQLSNRFKEATIRFVSYIYSVQPKELLASKPINGQMFTTLATHYVTAIQDGAILDIDDAFDAVAKIENSRIEKKTFEMFQNQMETIMLPVSSKVLEICYTKAQQIALDFLRKNVVFDKDGKCKDNAEMKMDNLRLRLKEENAQKFQEMCDKMIRQAYKESMEPKIENKTYEVSGGHRMFKGDYKKMKREIMSRLRDFEEHESLKTWHFFKETIKEEETNIIKADDALSAKQKTEPGNTTRESIIEISTQVTVTSTQRPETESSSHKFDEELTTRINEVSLRKSCGFSANDLEVFQKPLCFVSTDGQNCLKLETKVAEEIAKIDWPIVVVSVVGLYKTGKSYLMNRLAQSTKGFALGDTIESTTKGIWVWCKMHPEKSNTVLLLLDTEGLGDVEKGDSSHDNKIFILATLLCNCLVYNMKGAFDQDAVSKLKFVTEMARNIRFRGKSSDDNNNLSLILPDFVLCVRDFSLILFTGGKQISEDEYLEQSLAIQKGKDEKFNKPRECIQKYFPVRKCFTFPVPGDCNVLQNLETLEFSQLSDSFKEATIRFVSYIYSREPKKLLTSKPINGQMFTTLANHYVTAIQYAIIDVDDAFDAVAKIENSRIEKKAFEMFQKQIETVIFPVPSKVIESCYTNAQQIALDFLRKNVVFDKDGKCKDDVEMKMDNLSHRLKEENAQKFQEKCDKIIRQAYKESMEPKIENKTYEVSGGHRMFKGDYKKMKREIMSRLRDFEEHENMRPRVDDFIRKITTSINVSDGAGDQTGELWLTGPSLKTWHLFKETIKEEETNIIKADDALSAKQKTVSTQVTVTSTQRPETESHKFDEELTTRINEVSLRKSSGFSANDLEVFQKPLCFVSTDGQNCLKLETKVAEEIAKIDWPIVVVSVVGLYRTGKSYLMNRLAQSTKGFALGDRIESTTRGIWVWCKIHPEKSNTVLLLLDTEGLGDVEKGNPSHDNKIFTLATLLCNCLVYNMRGGFDQDVVSKLTFVTEMAKNIRFQGKSSDDNNSLKLILPDFVLCVRDFGLKLSKGGKNITEDEYFEQSLAIQKGRDDKFNKPRKCIQKYFPVRKCFTFPVPGDADVLENLETLEFSQLSNRFKEATTRFVSYIYSRQPKALLASKPINGQMFTALATHYVTAIRHGAVPDVDGAFSAAAKIENSRIGKEALEIFQNQMETIILPVPSKVIESCYTTAQQTSIKYLRQSVVNDIDGQCEFHAQTEMDNLWHKLKEKNTQKVTEMCDDNIQQAYKVSVEGKIENKTYEVSGGHRLFQEDMERMKKQFISSLPDFKENETLWTWLRFMETIKEKETKIIEVDNALTAKEKEDERKRNEENISTLIGEQKKSQQDAIEEQRKAMEEHFKRLEDDRQKQLENEKEKYRAKIEKEQADTEIRNMIEQQEKKKGNTWDHIDRSIQGVDKNNEERFKKMDEAIDIKLKDMETRNETFLKKMEERYEKRTEEMKQEILNAIKQ